MASTSRLLTNVAYGALGLSGLAFVAQTSLYNVDAGHCAVLFNRWSGVQQNVVGEGTHMLIPGLQVPHIFDVRTKPREIPSRTGSKDLQDVTITLRILYKPEINELPTIYNTYGVDYDDRILPSISNEVLKAVVAHFDAHELITQRENVSRQISSELRKAAAKYNIQCDDVAITQLSFGREFTLAVERKQVAQQEAEKQKYLVMIDEQEKRANIIRAEGEAEAAALVSEAYRESGRAHLELRRIETATHIAEMLAKNPNITYIPRGANMLLNMH